MTLPNLYQRGATGSNVVRTKYLKDLAEKFAEVSPEHGALLVDGPSGSGKTFAVRHLIDTEPRVVWLTCSAAPRGNELLRSMLKEYTGQRINKPRDWLLDILTDLMAEETVLVIDEAAFLDKSTMHVLRYLHDLPSSNTTLILVGTGIASKIQDAGEWTRRVGRTVHFWEIPAESLRKVLNKMHPIFQATSTEVMATLIGANNRLIATWASVIERAVAVGATPATGITPEQLDAVLNRTPILPRPAGGHRARVSR